MFTSLRSRLWLSYALVITVALLAVIVVLLVYLLRNPLLYRETLQRLRGVQTQLSTNPRELLQDTAKLREIAEANNARIVIFDATQTLVFDSNPDQPALRFRATPL